MAYCYNSYGYGYNNCNSGWYNWGRWVLLGVIVVLFILTFFCFSCVSARRRRKIGRKPMYGTGWATAGPFNGGPGYNPNYNQQQVPPQENNYNYNQNPSNAGYYHGQNESYYNGQQTGIHQPQNAYQPPSGPPPNKY